MLKQEKYFRSKKENQKKIEIKKFLKILKLKYEDKENQKGKKRED